MSIEVGIELLHVIYYIIAVIISGIAVSAITAIVQNSYLFSPLINKINSLYKKNKRIKNKTIKNKMYDKFLYGLTCPFCFSVQVSMVITLFLSKVMICPILIFNSYIVALMWLVCTAFAVQRIGYALFLNDINK